MVGRFLGGVRDADGKRGYVQIAGEVVAVDLATGEALWRRPQIGRPVAATARRLITLDRIGSEVALRLIDAATGADTGRIVGFGLPDWAARADLDDIQIGASEAAGGIRLDWTLRRLYRGGAPPPRDMTPDAQEPATGSIVIDPDTASAAPAGAATPVPPALQSHPETSSDPSVYALDRIGDRLFALRAQGSDTVLVARDARTGEVLWETPLSSQRNGGPTPLRK